MGGFQSLVYTNILWEPDGLSAEEREAKAKQYADERRRKKAIVRLWEQAVRQVRVRHPDPRVEVRTHIQEDEYSGALRIWYRMRNVRDTSDPDLLMSNFNHVADFSYQWPGYEPAQAYIASAWVLYMIHEGLELVTFRSPMWGLDIPKMQCSCGCGKVLLGKVSSERMVVDAHDTKGQHQKAISSGLADLASTIDWTLGLGAGAVLIDRNREQAAKEIEAELEPWIPGT